MGTKEELVQLFQRYIDRTISPGELGEFNILLNAGQCDADLEQLLTEVLSYMQLTRFTNSCESERESFWRLN